MKFGKRTIAVVGLAAGVCILATSAFADVIAGSGYNSLKEAGKNTIRQIATGEFDSFTANISVNYKVDGAEKGSFGGDVKVDYKNGKSESNSIESLNGKEESSYYTYHDKDKHISSYSEKPNEYRLQKLNGDDSVIPREDPFANEMVQDAEKIVDAFVGNLKDLVQVEETEGKKMYVGNLTESQVPTLANAVVSFMVKYSLDNNYSSVQTDELGIPVLKSDISLREMSGKAIENADGILESAVGSGTLVGKDKNGEEHTLTFEGTLSLTDINATTVTEPDLTGKKVETIEAGETSAPRFTDAYVGTYKKEIVKKEDGKFVKTGEAKLVIDSVTDGNATGTYTETYTSADYGKDLNIPITTTKIKSSYRAEFSYTDDGEEKLGVISLDMGGVGTVGVELNVKRQENGNGYSFSSDSYSGQLDRVFE